MCQRQLNHSRGSPSPLSSLGGLTLSLKATGRRNTLNIFSQEFCLCLEMILMTKEFREYISRHIELENSLVDRPTVHKNNDFCWEIFSIIIHNILFDGP